MGPGEGLVPRLSLQRSPSLEPQVQSLPTSDRLDDRLLLLASCFGGGDQWGGGVVTGTDLPNQASMRLVSEQFVKRKPPEETLTLGAEQRFRPGWARACPTSRWLPKPSRR